MEISQQNCSKLKLFTAQEVAAVLKMNVQVIVRKLNSSEIEGYKLGKEWRVSEEQLLNYLDRNSNKNRKMNDSEKILGNYIKESKLVSIPSTRKKREVILRYMVSKLDPDRVYSEKEINTFLKKFHQDVCTLRREFIACKLMVRKDGKYKVVGWNK